MLSSLPASAGAYHRFSIAPDASAMSLTKMNLPELRHATNERGTRQCAACTVRKGGGIVSYVLKEIKEKVAK